MLQKAKIFIIIFLSTFSLSAFAQKGILDSIRTVNQAIKTVDATVIEKQYLHSGKTKNCEGKLYLTAPNCFSIHFENDDQIIINADKMYFDHGMFHGNFNPKRNKMMNSIRCLLLYSFQGKCQELADECNYYMKTEKKNNEYVVTLTPKRKKLLDFSLVVLHYSMSYKLKEIEYTATVDDHSSYTIRNVKYNGPIKKEIFQF